MGLNQSAVVSVIITTYNHKSYIEQCLESILSQETNFIFEILIGEDQSSDGTRQICQKYEQRFPDKIRLFMRNRENVIYIKGKPTGRYNFIATINEAKGKYISICEGDDYWSDPLKLQKQVDLLEANPNLIACHHWQTMAIKKDGKFVVVEAPTENQGYYPKAVATVEDLFANRVRLKTRTVLFRNIIDADFFPPWFYKVAFGDVPLSYLLGKHGDFGFINEPMAVYRNTQEGASTTGLKEMGWKKFKVQHFKNWIAIWDHANTLYGYRYHTQATATVLDFYKTIVANLPGTFRSGRHLLYYDIFERTLPLHRKLVTSKWIVLFYGRKIGARLKRKVRS